MAIPTTLLRVFESLLLVRIPMTCSVVVIVELRSTSVRLHTPLASTCVGTEARRIPLMSRNFRLEFGKAENMATHWLVVRYVSLMLRWVS